jgi:CRISPR/Cas system-associated exonuclease Cas4 (RecB family)
LQGKAKRETNIREYKTKKGVVQIGDHLDLGQNYPDADPVGILFGCMRLGENILKRFYERHIAEKRLENGRKPPIHNEFGFGVKKAEPFLINGIPIIGFIDRIDEKNGKFWIADYKTDKGSPERDPFILHRHPQFTIYSYAFRKIFKEKEKAILYYHLRSGKVFETHRSEKDYEYVKRLIDDVVDGISKDKFVPFYGFHCKFCDLKVACEKYSLKHHGGPRIDLEGKIKTANTFDAWDAPLPEKANWIADMQEEKS